MTIVRPAGRLHAEHLPLLENEINAHLAIIATKPLAIDMSEVTYIDAAGLGAFVRLHNTVKANGGTLRLTGLQGLPRELFLLCKLDKVLQIDPH